MARYKNKPVFIEAFQLRGKGPSPTPWWFSSKDIKKFTPDGLIIRTPLRDFEVFWDYYIIRDELGELYSCPPNVFDKTYTYISE